MEKILITTSSFNLDCPEIQAIKMAGYEVVLNPHKRRLSEDEVLTLLQDGYVGVIAGLEPLTRRVLESAKNLRVVSRCGIGLDNVDLNAARDLGIDVLNTPDGPTEAVAELTVGLMLSALRSIGLQDRAIRDGKWERPMGGLLGAKVVGLIGYGRIGRRVAELVRAFGASVIPYDPFVQGSEVSSLDEVLKQVDIISLHIPYTSENDRLIGAEQIARMKKGAILINSARGGLVDEDAVAEALQSGHLAAAGFDVFEEEPYKGPLKECANAILTAHTGSYAHETRLKQEAQAAEFLLAALHANKQKVKHHG